MNRQRRLSQIAAAVPNWYTADYRIGKLLEEDGNVPAAMRESRVAMGKPGSKQGSADAALSLARLLQDERDGIKESKAAYQQAVELRPYLARVIKAVVLCFFCSALGSGAPKDPFAGTWLLNPAKSIFHSKVDTYGSGARTYSPTQDGQHVTWDMVDAQGLRDHGEYTVHCRRNECTSDVVRWRQTKPGVLTGETLERGKVIAHYTRSISPDGSVLTITFYKDSPNTPTSIQVWERQK